MKDTSLRSANKFTEVTHTSNIHGTAEGQEKIVAWTMTSPTAFPSRSAAVAGFILTGGYYSTGQLQVKVAKDEEGRQTREYTNRSGQLVLRKVQLAGNTGLQLYNRDHWTQTYYVYDDFGYLRYVIPPELSYRVHQNDFYNPSSTDITNWAFQYTYDSRGRVATKTLPGAAAVYFIYDNRDRLILTQDANQRSTTKYWTFSKYDLQNRLIMTGIKDTAVTLTQGQMQNVVDAFFAKPSSRWGESYVGSGAGNIFGYSNKSYPVFTTGTNADASKYLTVTYYDNYDFTSLFGSAHFDFHSNELPSVKWFHQV